MLVNTKGTLMIFTIYSIIISLLLSCENATSVSDPIVISEPNSQSVWYICSDDASIEWSGGNTDEVDISLYKNSELVTIIEESVANTGSVQINVDPQWNLGNDYSIRIIDGSLETGESEEFSIASRPFIVTNPSSATTWLYTESDHDIEWSGGNSDYANIYLTDNSDIIDTLSVNTLNDGFFNYQDGVQISWGYGDDFQIALSDNSEAYGVSELFYIENISNSEIIEVNEPEINSILIIGDEVLIEWGNSPGNEMDIELWKDGSHYLDLVSNTPNDGLHTVSISCEQASGYQFRISDELGNYGFSGMFVVADESINNSLIGYWALNGNTADSSGNGHDGNSIGVSWVEGIRGLCGEFGISDLIIVGENIPQMKVQTFSLSMWICPMSGGTLFRNRNRDWPEGGWYFNGGDNYLITVYAGYKDGMLGSWYGYLKYESGSSMNEWHHVCVTKSNTDYQLYIDGVLVKTDQGQDELYYSDTIETSISFSGNMSYSGKIDEVRFYERELTESEINLLSSAIR